jgi:hypothetical protein
MSRASVLARGRVAAEAGMVDTCTIRRRTGTSTDRDTGATIPVYATQYTGKCRVQQATAQAQQAEAGQDHLLLLRLEVQLPMSVTGLEVGDEVTIDTSAHDADLPGRVFTVRDLAHKTHATARRVQVIEKTD